MITNINQLVPFFNYHSKISVSKDHVGIRPTHFDDKKQETFLAMSNQSVGFQLTSSYWN